MRSGTLAMRLIVMELGRFMAQGRTKALSVRKTPSQQ
jgi:hypothetical protein